MNNNKKNTIINKNHLIHYQKDQILLQDINKCHNHGNKQNFYNLQMDKKKEENYNLIQEWNNKNKN